jgi:hypothetical protein
MLAHINFIIEHWHHLSEENKFALSAAIKCGAQVTGMLFDNSLLDSLLNVLQSERLNNNIQLNVV